MDGLRMVGCWVVSLLCAFKPVEIDCKARTVVWTQVVPGLHFMW